MALGGRHRLRARISFSLKSIDEKLLVWADAIQKIENLANNFAEDARAQLYKDFYNAFRGLAGARIEAYRNSGTSHSPGPTGTPPTGNLFRSIDAKISTSAGMRIFVHTEQAPYASVHDVPEGETTPIMAKNARQLVFYFHREGRWAYFKPPAMVLRPGTGFFTDSFFDTADMLESLYEDIKDELVTKYNTGAGSTSKALRKRI